MGELIYQLLYASRVAAKWVIAFISKVKTKSKPRDNE